MARQVNLDVDGEQITIEVAEDVTDQEIQDFVIANEDTLVSKASGIHQSRRQNELETEAAEDLDPVESFLVGAGHEIQAGVRGVAQAGLAATQQFVESLPDNERRIADAEALEIMQERLAEAQDSDDAAFAVLDELEGTRKMTGAMGAEDIGQFTVDALTLALGGGSVKGVTAAGSILGGLEVKQGDESRSMNALSGGLTGLLAGIGGKVVGGFIPGAKIGESAIGKNLKALGVGQSKVKTIDKMLSVAKFIPGVRLLALDRVMGAALRRASGQQLNALEKAFASGGKTGLKEAKKDAALAVQRAARGNPTAEQQAALQKAIKDLEKLESKAVQKEAVIRFISPLLGGPGFDSEAD